MRATILVRLAIVLVLLMLLPSLHAAGPGTRPTPVDTLPQMEELPDPFIFSDGSAVKSPADWPRRRAELKELILSIEYGHLPPVEGKVQAAEVPPEKQTPAGAVEKQFVLAMGPQGQVHTHLFLTLPAGKGPFPVIITGDLGWGRVKEPIAAEVVHRGYALAEFNRVEIAPDEKENRKSGVYAVYPDGDGGCLAAWAWGYQRVIDYLLTLDVIDPGKITVTGHSRGGKSTLLAGATDERVALTVPNGSGAGGAGSFRVQPPKTEDIGALVTRFPFWFSPRLSDFVGQVDRLPFDQHSLKALVAPRALLTTDALGDHWANSEGTQQTYLAAREVYAFLGVPQNIGLHYRQGGHEQNDEDWGTLLDFADRLYFGKSVSRRFDELPDPDAVKAFSWSAPRP